MKEKKKKRKQTKEKENEVRGKRRREDTTIGMLVRAALHNAEGEPFSITRMKC